MHEERSDSDRADDAEPTQPHWSAKNAERVSSSTDERMKTLKRKTGWIRSSAYRCQRLKRLLVDLPFLCHFLLIALLVTPGSAQFGEIASLITGILGSGGAGLAGTGAGLAGTAGSLAGAGSAAGAGASSVLSNIGPLYQLAQAALQLTGTGVGIANQASEGAWFPVAVENTARMNRDFQDRFLGRRVRPESSSGGEGSGTDNTEYGRNFGSGESTSTDNTDGDGGGSSSSFLGSSSAGRPPPFGGLLGGSGSSSSVSAAGRLPTPLLPQLPGLESLLPGETPPRSVRVRGGGTSASLPTTGGGSGGNSLERFGVVSGRGDASAFRGATSGTGGGRVIGIGTVEQVPLSPPIYGPSGDTGPKIRIELPDERPSAEVDASAVHPQLPENGGESKKKEPSIEFSVDDGTSSEANDREDGEDESSVKDNGHPSAAFGTPLLPSTFTGEDSELISAISAGRLLPQRTSASTERRKITTELSARRKIGEAEADPMTAAQSMAALIARQIDDGRMPEMVPELRRLIHALRDSRLTREEFIEIANQLESNKDLLAPRENTTPSPESVVTGVYHQAGDDNTNGESVSAPSSGNVSSPTALLFGGQRDRAALRNLSAFRGALDDADNTSLSPADALALGGQRGNRTSALRNLAALRSALRSDVEAGTNDASSHLASDASMTILRRLRLTNASSDAEEATSTTARPVVVLAMEDARAHHFHTVGGAGSLEFEGGSRNHRLLSTSSTERLQRAKVHAVVPYRRHVEEPPSSDKSATVSRVVSGLASPSSAAPTANTPSTFIFDTANPPQVQASTNTQQPHQIFTQPHPFFVTATQPYPQQRQQTYTPQQQQQQQQLPQQQQAQQQADYNRAYRDYINYYYPQYAQLYNTLHLQPQQPAVAGAVATATQQLQQTALSSQSDPIRVQPVPRRIVAEPVATTPPSSLQHPFSQGALLTLMQPPQQPAAAVPPSLPQLFQPPPPSQWGRKR